MKKMITNDMTYFLLVKNMTLHKTIRRILIMIIEHCFDFYEIRVVIV